MASNIVKYFLKEDIDNELICQVCKVMFDLLFYKPKHLPCSCSICSKCEQKLLSINSNEIKCLLCYEIFDRPKNEFPVNKLIQKFLLKEPREVKRSELHQQTYKNIEELILICENFNKNLHNTESMVKEYCNLLKDNVDIRTESIISIINNHRDGLLKKIDEYEKEHLTNTKDLKKFELLISNSENKFKSWLEYLNQAYLVDSEIKKILDETIVLKRDFNNILESLSSCVLGDNKLEFIESNNKIENSIIGVFKQLTPVEQIRRLKDQKSVVSVNYRIEGNEIDYRQVKVIEIESDKFLVIMGLRDNSLGWLIKMKLISLDGILIRENTEKFSNEKFFAVKFQNNALVACKYPVYSLILYDVDLNVTRSEKIDYMVNELCAFNNEIYVYASKRDAFYILNFDECLNLKKSILLDKNSFYLNHDFKNGARLSINFGNIYSYLNNKITVYELENIKSKAVLELKLSKTSHDSDTFAYAYQNNGYVFQAISPDNFILVDSKSLQLKVFNFKNECLLEFQLLNINHISSLFITEKGYLVLHDDKVNEIKIIKG